MFNQLISNLIFKLLASCLLPVESEHTGVDVNVGDLKDETLKCHIERWHIERRHILFLVELESFVIELCAIFLNWISLLLCSRSHLDKSLES